MTPEQTMQLQQLQTNVTNLNIEMVELKKLLREPELTAIGRAQDGIITLQELEATVKVLANYKRQGFTTIQL